MLPIVHQLLVKNQFSDTFPIFGRKINFETLLQFSDQQPILRHLSNFFTKKRGRSIFRTNFNFRGTNLIWYPPDGLIWYHPVGKKVVDFKVRTLNSEFFEGLSKTAWLKGRVWGETSSKTGGESRF